MMNSSLALLVVAVFCLSTFVAANTFPQSATIADYPKGNGNVTQTMTHDNNNPLYVWVGVSANNTIANDTMLQGSYVDVSFMPKGGNVSIAKWHYEFTDFPANAAVDQGFPPFDGAAGGSGNGEWTFLWQWGDAVADNTTDLVVTFQFSMTEGQLDPEGKNTFSIVAPGLVLPLNITNTTSISMAFEASDDDANIDDLIGVVSVYKECDDNPTPCLVPNGQFMVNGTAEFNITSLEVKMYYVEFSSALSWSTFDAIKNKVEVTIDSSVPQEFSSNDSGSNFLGMPNWFWYTLIGVVVVVAMLLIIAAVVGMVVLRKRNSYDSV